MSVEKYVPDSARRVKELKIAGQMLIDRAEEFIGSNELCCGRKITIHFPIRDRLPYITVETDTTVDTFGATGRYEVLDE